MLPPRGRRPRSDSADRARGGRASAGGMQGLCCRALVSRDAQKCVTPHALATRQRLRRAAFRPSVPSGEYRFPAVPKEDGRAACCTVGCRAVAPTRCLALPVRTSETSYADSLELLFQTFSNLTGPFSSLTVCLPCQCRMVPAGSTPRGTDRGTSQDRRLLPAASRPQQPLR